MAHDSQKRREATAIPLVLFGEHGRTVEGYRPADEDLTAAAPGRADWGKWRPVKGPHLRAVRRNYATSKTGIVGICCSHNSKNGRNYIVANLGRTCRKFCIETMGRSEAFERALTLRREHERKITQANAVILRARENNGGHAA